ncbi:MAG TPA: HAMP domain-containing sensor histidine kinase [Ruminiclostridium sp.]
MKISLKTKLFGAFFGLIVFSVTLSLVLNSTLLEKYYYNKKEDIMLQSFHTIQESYKVDADNIMLDIEKIESLRGIGILIFDKDLNVIYQSRQRNMGIKGPKIEVRDPLLDGKNLSEKLKIIQKDKPLIEMRYDKRMESSFVSLYGQIDDNVYLYLGVPVVAIQESAKIAIRFSVYTGILSILLGGIIIFLLSSRLTKPIVKLNGIAKKMAVLDFTEKYNVRSKDEIGTLGESINSLSHQLERSIGELTQANSKLKQDIEKERKIDEMRKGFISNVSHELKTPIALVQGYAEGLKLNINDDEENKNYYCEVIIDEANKMNSMVKKLLELSELEFNDISLDREDFCICELIKNVLKKNSLIFAEKEAEVTFNSNENEGALINADYYLTEQVLMNFLSNAVNHLDDKRILSIDLKIIDNKARVEVFNSGKNIPQEAIENVWMSFYKVDKARTRSYGGTGLGLSIVKAIQKSHNNEYGVTNMTNGVLFWFEADLANF